jgi:hypothetical protein
VSGLDTPFFGEAVMAVNKIYGMFDQAFTDGALGPWNLTECHRLSIEALNHYFTPVRQGSALMSAPFQENVDPCGVLAKMEASPGAWCMHTEDNEVEYCCVFREANGRYRYVFLVTGVVPMLTLAHAGELQVWGLSTSII